MDTDPETPTIESHILKTGKHLTRREFLLSILGLAGFRLLEKAESKFVEKTSDKAPDVLPELVLNPYLTLVPVAVNRGVDSPQLVGDVARQIISSCDAAVVEYFPPEMTEFTQNPILGLAAEQTTDLGGIVNYYSQVELASAQADKPIYVLDPAYTSAFGILTRGLPDIAAVTGAVGVMEAVDSRKDISNLLRGKKKINRRDFLVGAAYATSAALLATAGKYVGSMVGESVSGSPDLSSGNANENAIRRTIISQGLLDISELQKQAGRPLRLGFFYSPHHIKRLQDLMRDPQLQHQHFSEVSVLNQGWLGETFFTGRKYHFDKPQAKWTLEDKWNIGNSST